MKNIKLIKRRYELDWMYRYFIFFGVLSLLFETDYYFNHNSFIKGFLFLLLVFCNCYMAGLVRIKQSENLK